MLDRASAVVTDRTQEAVAQGEPISSLGWHAQTAEAVVRTLATTRAGLSRDEAASRLDSYGPNALPEQKPPSLLALFLRQFRSPLIYLLLGVATIAFLLGEESDALVTRLWENAAVFRSAMHALGFDTGHSATPIVPVMLGEAPLAQRFSRRLFEEGVFAMAIGYPTVPLGKARIRVMNSAAHSRDDLERALDIFERVGKELKVIK